MLLIAHGGYSAKYPENTQLSYEKALEHNPDGLEMDVVYHNGEVYFYHPVGNKNSFGDDVDQLIKAQLTEKLSNNEMIFSLSDSDILSTYLKQTKFLNFDIKQKSINNALNILERINELDFSASQIYIGARDLDRVERFNKVNFQGKLISLDQDPETYKQYIDAGVEYIRIWFKDLNASIVEDIHQYGGKVIVNIKEELPDSIARTAGNFSEQRLKEVDSLGVDGVLINNIELGRKLFPL